MVHIDVSGTGPGIALQIMDKLVEPFVAYRDALHDSDDPKRRGSRPGHLPRSGPPRGRQHTVESVVGAGATFHAPIAQG